jgi:hypothetical protein
MKRSAIVIFGLGLAFGCGAEGSICHLLPPSLAADGSVEVAFSTSAEWNFSDVVRFEDLYVREGAVLYLPWGKNIVEKRGRLRLAAGETIRLVRPHEGCSIQAINDHGRAGLLVKWGMSLPGPVHRPATRREFLPAKGAQ